MRWPIALVSGLALACSHSKPAAKPTPAPPPPTEPAADTAAPPATTTPTDAELEAMFASMLHFVEELATAAEANHGQCPAMAKALDGVIDRNVAVLRQARSLEGNDDVKAKGKAYLSAHAGEQKAAGERFVTALDACVNDAAVQTALGRIDQI